MGSEYPLPSRLGDLGNVVSGVRVGTPAEKDFRKIWRPKNAFVDRYLNEFYAVGLAATW